jgi:hypothetical protein
MTFLRSWLVRVAPCRSNGILGSCIILRRKLRRMRSGGGYQVFFVFVKLFLGLACTAMKPKPVAGSGAPNTVPRFKLPCVLRKPSDVCVLRIELPPHLPTFCRNLISYTMHRNNRHPGEHSLRLLLICVFAPVVVSFASCLSLHCYVFGLPPIGCALRTLSTCSTGRLARLFHVLGISTASLHSIWRQLM